MFTLASTLSTFFSSLFVFLSNNQNLKDSLPLNQVSSFNAFLILADMKLTSNLLQVPTPNSTEELSCFYNLFQEALQEMKEMKNTTSPTGTNSNKRRRKSAEATEEEEDSSNKNSLKNIFTSLLLLEEEETADQQESNKSAEEEKSLFDTNHNKKTQVMLDYYSQLQNYCSDVEESENLRIKRSRLSTTSGLLSVASKISSENTTSPNSTVTTTQPQGGQQQHRRLWVKDRSKAWWDRCNHPDFPDSEFRQAFRMSRATFDMICDELNSVVAKEDTMLRQAIPVQQRVAVCIWRLATGEPLRLVSKRFGLGISTCHKLVLEVCSAIRTVLMPKFLNWPDEEGVEKIKKDYESISGIPNVVGSMYTTHIPIIAPKVSVAAYFNKRHTERNQKTSYSITVQGVVNPNGAFTDVCIGWPGSFPDDQVLEKSALCTRANGGLMKGVWIVGSSGYPLMDWVLVPYTQPRLTWTEHAFNEKIGEVQRVAKDAFARLKGRWGCLQKRTEVKLQDLPVVLGACCVLHNICEIRNEEIDPELRFDLVDDEMVPERNIRSESSRVARDGIAHNLLHHQHAGTSFM